MHEHWKPTSEHGLRLASLRYLARYLTRYVQAELLTSKPRQLFLLSRVPVEAESAAKFIRGHKELYIYLLPFVFWLVSASLKHLELN